MGLATNVDIVAVSYTHIVFLCGFGAEDQMSPLARVGTGTLVDVHGSSERNIKSSSEEENQHHTRPMLREPRQRVYQGIKRQHLTFLPIWFQWYLYQPIKHSAQRPLSTSHTLGLDPKNSLELRQNEAVPLDRLPGTRERSCICHCDSGSGAEHRGYCETLRGHR